MNIKAKTEQSFDIDIDVRDRRWCEEIPSVEQDTHSLIKRILETQLGNTEHIEISIVLSHDSFVQDLNKQYREKDKPTNVLSFPQTELEEIEEASPFVCLGDIIIAFETIKEEATEQNKATKDHYTHMLVHGCLHLLHYDHETDEEAQKMENLEIEILNDLGIKNPYEVQ